MREPSELALPGRSLEASRSRGTVSIPEEEVKKEHALEVVESDSSESLSSFVRSLISQDEYWPTPLIESSFIAVIVDRYEQAGIPLNWHAFRPELDLAIRRAFRSGNREGAERLEQLLTGETPPSVGSERFKAFCKHFSGDIRQGYLNLALTILKEGSSASADTVPVSLEEAFLAVEEQTGVAVDWSDSILRTQAKKQLSAWIVSEQHTYYDALEGLSGITKEEVEREEAIQWEYRHLLETGRFESLTQKIATTGVALDCSREELATVIELRLSELFLRRELGTLESSFGHINAFVPGAITSERVQTVFWQVASPMATDRFQGLVQELVAIGYPPRVTSVHERTVAIRHVVTSIAKGDKKGADAIQRSFGMQLDRNDPLFVNQTVNVIQELLEDQNGQRGLERLKEEGCYTPAVERMAAPIGERFYESQNPFCFIDRFRSHLLLGMTPSVDQYPQLKKQCTKDVEEYFRGRDVKDFRFGAWLSERKPIWNFIGYVPFWQLYQDKLEIWATYCLRQGEWRDILRFEQQTGYVCFSRGSEMLKQTIIDEEVKKAMAAWVARSHFADRREFITFGLLDRIGLDAQIAYLDFYDNQPQTFSKLVAETGRSADSLIGLSVQARFAGAINAAHLKPAQTKETKERYCTQYGVSEALFDPNLPCYDDARRSYTVQSYYNQFMSLEDHVSEPDPQYLTEANSAEMIDRIWFEIMENGSFVSSDTHPMFVQFIIGADKKGFPRPDLSTPKYNKLFRQAFLNGCSVDLNKTLEATKLLTKSEYASLKWGFATNDRVLQTLYANTSLANGGSLRWLQIYAFSEVPPDVSHQYKREKFAEFLTQETGLDQTSFGMSFCEFGKMHGFDLYSDECLMAYGRVVDERPAYIYALLRDGLEAEPALTLGWLLAKAAPSLLAHLALQKEKEDPDSPVVAELKATARTKALHQTLAKAPTSALIVEISLLFGESPIERARWVKESLPSVPTALMRDAFTYVKTAEEYLQRVGLIGMPDLGNQYERLAWQSITLRTAQQDSLEAAEAFLQATDPSEIFERISEPQEANVLGFKRQLVKEGNLEKILHAQRVLKIQVISKTFVNTLGTSSQELPLYLALLGPLKSLLSDNNHQDVRGMAHAVAKSAYTLGEYKQLLPLLPFLKRRIASEILRTTLVERMVVSGSGVLPEGLMEIFGYYQEPLTILPEDYRLLSAGLSLRLIADIYQHKLPADGQDRAKAIQYLFRCDSTYAYIPELLAIRAPSRREEFCPYHNAVDPLFSSLSSGGSDLSSPEYRKGLTEYFRAFGLHHLPILARTVVDIFACDDRRPERAAQNLKESQSSSIKEVKTLCQMKEGATPREYIERMKWFQAQLRERLLADGELPAGLEFSPLGMELFNALIPSAGSYHEEDDRPSLITETRELVQRFPVPTFLGAQTVSVTARNNEESMENEVLERLEELTHRRHEKLMEEPLVTFLAPWNEAVRLMSTDAALQKSAWWIARVRVRLDHLRKELHEKADGIANKKGREALQKQERVLELCIARATQIEERLMTQKESPKTAKEWYQEILRALQELYTDEAGKVNARELVSGAREEAYALFVGLMKAYAPAHLAEIERPIIPAGLPLTAHEQVRTENWIKYFYEEYLEHFSRVIEIPDPEQGGVEKRARVTRQIPEDLEALMHRLWRTRGTSELFRAAGYDKDKKVPDHPIVNVARAIQVIERSRELLLRGEDESESLDFRISPCHGMGRVLSGDIADACFHSLREEFAQGEYPEITALIFSFPGKDQELAGSALCIDIQNQSGERVLVIRALNPTEAVVQRDIQAESLVKAVADYLIQAAQAETSGKPVMEVRICIDRRGGHSTNRQSVHEAEQKLLQTVWKGAERSETLLNVPATNFNGYQIWQSGATACIWRRS